MTNKITNSLLVLAVGGLMIGSAAAQTTTPVAPAPTTPTAPTNTVPATTSSPTPTSPNPSGKPNVASGPGVQDPGHPRINQVDNRQQNQQNRVANDIKDGKMTPAQAAQVEKSDARIENQEKADIAQDGGRHITKAQQRQLNREQNRVNHKILKDQHSNKK